jgi:hypothetical protein
MNVTIIHIGGTEKLCELESFDAPRPWVRLRYPNGGGGVVLRARARRHRSEAGNHA